MCNVEKEVFPVYQIGDLLIYGSEGVCRVDEIGPSRNFGIAGDRLFYALSPLYREGRVYTPVDTSVYMRPVLSREDALELIHNIPHMGAKVCQERSPRGLVDYYQACLRSHDNRELVRMIQGVYQKQKAAIVKGRKLGQADERYMKQAVYILHGELAVALGIPFEEVPDYIQRIINRDERRGRESAG